MRELNTKELDTVAGGLIFDRIGKKIGEAIGSTVSPDVVGAAGQLGKGIGYILELNVVGAVRNMGAGIRGIVDWAKANKKPA